MLIPGFTSVLLLAGAVSAEVAHVLLPDHATPQTKPRIVSPSDARLVLAQRLGLSDFHSLKDANEETVEALNALGGKAQPLFGGQIQTETPRRAIIVVEEAEDLFDLRVSTGRLSFAIDDAPSPNTNHQLLQSFVQQRRHLEHDQVGPTLEAELFRTFGEEKEHLRTSVGGNDIFVQYNGLALAKKKDGQSSSWYAAKTATVRKALSSLMMKDLDIIVVLMPTYKSGGLFKRLESSYGPLGVLPGKRQVSLDNTAILPASQGESSSDSSSGLIADLFNNAMEELEEMEEALESAIFANSNSTNSTNPTNPSNPTTPANSTSPSSNQTVTPPRGILPVCYSSQSACQSRTHGCSGHGSCKLAYSYGGDDKVNCYACACTPTVRTNKDGTKKTTIWAGPACQKKDVSMPFWLIGGFTIALTSVVAWGIGLLYAMGQEELPSVIGAGVAGPRAKQ